MMHDIILGLGMVAVIEGLVLALAPLRFQELLKMLSEISRETRQWIGVGFAVFGVVLIALAKTLVS